MNNIIVEGAREGNLKNISLEIPRNKLVVFTGLSGSGKTTLAIDTIYQECQRQYLEAIGYQGIQKPKLDMIRNASPAIRITQQSTGNKNPRSSVGTVTNIYTDLRMIYEKLSKRTCPNCQEEIAASNCREELEKSSDGSFTVYMYCNHCQYKMEKLTRSHFSYNTREGACPTCQGLGKVMQINERAVIQEHLSLEEGAVTLWGEQTTYKDYQVNNILKTFKHYGVPVKANIPVQQFSEGQKALLLYGTESNEVKELFPDVIPPKTVSQGKFEGVYTSLWRRLSEKGGDGQRYDAFFESETCHDCNGERLNVTSRSATVLDTRLPELVLLSLDELHQWLETLESTLNEQEQRLVEPYVLDLDTKIQRIINVGLGYLTLDRQSMTLSGGEAQRIKLAATLDSQITGVIYILDEPTIGLHPKDTVGIIKVLKQLRDKGNTVIVIEHDVDVMRAADFIVDIGPRSGKYGGEIIGTGTLEELMQMESSITGQYLKRSAPESSPRRTRTGKYIEVHNGNLHNLQNVHVKFPIGCLTSVTGVSGSGKSTLVFDIIGNPANHNATASNRVVGMDNFNEMIIVEQSPLTRMKRSNVATYSDIYGEIRKIFGNLDEAKEKGLSAKHFSFNTPGGRCEHCEGLGYVVSNMLFFEDIEVVCPVCGGNQFNDEVLSVKYEGYSIKDVLRMPVDEAVNLFAGHKKIRKTLKLLQDVGLGYLELGQTLTTLSGGEGQRLKLATELVKHEGKNNVYLIDEPTTGLHPVDVDNFLVLLHRMVDAGNTVIVVEHNPQVIQSSDWIVDLGPEGGVNGGHIVAVGTPEDIRNNAASVTGKYI